MRFALILIPVLLLAGCAGDPAAATLAKCGKVTTKQYFKLNPDTPTSEIVKIADLAAKSCKAARAKDPGGFDKLWD